MLKIIVIVGIGLLIVALIGFVIHSIFSKDPSDSEESNHINNDSFPIATRYCQELEDFLQNLDDIIFVSQDKDSSQDLTGFHEKIRELNKLALNLQGCIKESPASASKLTSLEYLVEVSSAVLSHYRIYFRYMTDSQQSAKFMETLNDGIDNIIRVFRQCIDGILDDKISNVNTEIQTLTAWYQMHGKEMAVNFEVE